MRGSDFEARGRGRGLGDGRSGGRAVEVIYYYCCKESWHTKYIAHYYKRSSSTCRSAHVATTQKEQSDSSRGDEGPVVSNVLPVSDIIHSTFFHSHFGPASHFGPDR